MLIWLAILRFVTITGGVVTGEVTIDSAFASTVSADAASGVLNVTARPDCVVGGTYSGPLAAGQSRVAQVGDVCAGPAAIKLVPFSTVAAQLTAAEWTAAQTRIAAGDKTTAGALTVLLGAASTSAAQTAVNTLVTQGVVTALRASAINAALAVAAQ